MLHQIILFLNRVYSFLFFKKNSQLLLTLTPPWCGAVFLIHHGLISWLAGHQPQKREPGTTHWPIAWSSSRWYSCELAFHPHQGDFREAERTFHKSNGQNITSQPTLRVGYKAPHKCASLTSAPQNPTLFPHPDHCVDCAHVAGAFSVPKVPHTLIALLLSHILFLCQEGLFSPSPPVEILVMLKMSVQFSSCVLVSLGCHRIRPQTGWLSRYFFLMVLEAGKSKLKEPTWWGSGGVLVRTLFPACLITAQRVSKPSGVSCY